MAMNSLLTNTAASSAQRFLTMAGGKAESSISKLSSGSRIVKPSDDAASLAISNKLRADIATFNQASRNASQGASLLQVAGGGLSQIGDLLTRMKTLSTQVVNGTLSSSERQFVQQEFSQMITQVGEIASQTQVNGIAMLNGGAKVFGETAKQAALASATDDVASGTTALGATGATDFTVGNIRGQVQGEVRSVNTTDLGGQTQIEVVIGNQTFRGVVAETAATNSVIEMRDVNNNFNGFDLTVTASALTTAATTGNDLRATFNLSVNNASVVRFESAAVDEAAAAALINSTATTFSSAIKASGATPNQTYTLASRYTAANAATGAVEQVEYRLTGEDGKSYSAVVLDENTGTANNILSAGTKTVKFGNGIEITVNATAINATAAAADAGSLGFADARGVQFRVSPGQTTSLDFQVGVQSSDVLNITFDSMTTASLGIANLNIETVANAQAATDAIEIALNRVNTATAQVGAFQSRMEYVQSNLATVIENLEAANGIFKDVDMAKEMTEFTKQQTLMQAGVSMLSQANQIPQMLMRLIQ
jgi:flagellin